MGRPNVSFGGERCWTCIFWVWSPPIEIYYMIPKVLYLIWSPKSCIGITSFFWPTLISSRSEDGGSFARCRNTMAAGRFSHQWDFGIPWACLAAATSQFLWRKKDGCSENWESTYSGRLVGSLMLPSLKLTVCPWKMVVGKLLSFWKRN